METKRGYDPDKVPHQVGNQVPRYSGWKQQRHWQVISRERKLETKYRDIADGNRIRRSGLLVADHWLETKYRDIADGNDLMLSL